MERLISDIVHQRISESITLKQEVLKDSALLMQVGQVVELCVEAIRLDHKILFCGNGGSAADAQHLAAEFSGRFYQDRDPYFAEALHVNTSYLTAVANDYSYDEVYARLVKAKARPGDVVIGMSTSGNSENVVRALQQAIDLGASTVAFTGDGGGRMGEIVHITLSVPSRDTPRIQEVHMLLGHIICELVESTLINDDI